MHVPANKQESCPLLSIFNLKKLVSSFSIASFASFALLASLFVATTPAKAALIVDANNATFTFVNRTTISGSGGAGDGDVEKFTNVATVGGIVIDAVVTTDIVQSGTVNETPRITQYDPGTTPNYLDLNVSATSGSNFFGYINLNFKFYEGGTYSGPGTGNQLTLKDLRVFSLDIDSGNQFSDFKGFQQFKVNTTTRLRYTGGANAIPGNLDATSPFVRFLSGSGASGNNAVEDQVEVVYLSTDDFDIRVGNAQADGQAYFAIGFGAGPWGNSQTITSNNPRNTPPTSTDTAKYVPTTGNVILTRSDFGTYADADANAFSKVKITALPTAGTLEYLNGSNWSGVTAGSYVNVSAIDSGELRLVMNSTSGTVDSQFKFLVNDSLSDSTSTYTLTLTVSPIPQVITFANPGTQALGATVVSNATADSTLVVTLTSNSTGICTVSGLNIVSTRVAGLCEIVATQVGNATYSAAPNVSQSFYFSAGTAQTITFANPGDQPLTQGTVVVAATASSTLTVTLTSLTAPVCTMNQFTITLVAAGTCTIRASQGGGTVGQTTYGPASPVSQSFLVTAANQFNNNQNQTVTFDSNYGVSTTTTQSVANGVATQLNANTFSRSGYTFAGWNTAANGSGTAYADGASVTLANDITLYAQWSYIVPDPVQTDEVIEINPGEGLIGTTVVISGRFNRTISNVTLNGNPLTPGSWVQTPTTVTLTINGGYKGVVTIQLYNGAVPLLKSVAFKVLELVAPITPKQKEKPVVVWPKPAAIIEGTPLSTSQLNANSVVPGRYEYVNVPGQLFPAGKQILKLRFIPNDLDKYEIVEVEVELEIKKLIAPSATAVTTPADTNANSKVLNISKDAKLQVKLTGAGLDGASITSSLEVLVDPKLTFSGKTTVTVTVVDDGQTVDITVPVMVLPLAPTDGRSVPSGLGISTVSWSASPNAISYEVLVSGAKLCETSNTSCEVSALIGPKTKVELLAKGNDATASNLAVAGYQAPENPVLAAVKNFATASFELRPSVRRELRALAAEISAAGFTRLQVQGHTDIRGGVDNSVLSRNRAQETIKFLQRLLPDVKFKIGYFASTKPAADNSTKEGLAANRRVEIAIW